MSCGTFPATLMPASKPSEAERQALSTASAGPGIAVLINRQEAGVEAPVGI